jgi:hypothetical protein
MMIDDDYLIHDWNTEKLRAVLLEFKCVDSQVFHSHLILTAATLHDRVANKV